MADLSTRSFRLATTMKNKYATCWGCRLRGRGLPRDLQHNHRGPDKAIRAAARMLAMEPVGCQFCLLAVHCLRHACMDGQSVCRALI